MLLVQAGELDLARFEQLSDEARSSRAGGGVEQLQEALALWRGPALADLAYEAFAQAEVARLEEMRLAASSSGSTPTSRSGGTPEVVGDLRGARARATRCASVCAAS